LEAPVDQETRHEVERSKWDAHAHNSDVTRELGPEDILAPDVTFERYATARLRRRIDGLILRRVPSAWRLCRYGILFMRKSEALAEASSQ
jgi:hypothetical protein